MRRALVAALALSVFVVAARADDDPEPPGGALRKLRGVWKNRAVLVQGKEREAAATYVFAGDKVTYSFGTKGGKREMTLVPDKKRKDLFQMKEERGRSLRYFFKFEKGELFLVPVRPTDADPRPDFSGDTAPVLILKREGK
jgi:uncharacterized protein (TIGR03067 family)